MGNEIFETQYFYGELIDTLLYIKFEYESIDDKILVKSIECLLDTSDAFYDEKELFEYHSLGREIQYKKLRRDNSLYLIQSTDYENLSRILKFYRTDSLCEQTDSMIINTLGKVTEAFTFKNGIPIKTTEISYNEQGLILSELRLSKNDSLLFQYEYNELGQEIYFKGFIDDSLIFVRSTSYLDNGLIIKYEEKDFGKKNSKLDIYEYEFY